MHRNKPAFPGVRIDQDTGLAKHEPGMTLRDYWAMEYIKLMWANWLDDPRENLLELQKRAYKAADSMAEARDHDA